MTEAMRHWPSRSITVLPEEHAPKTATSFGFPPTVFVTVFVHCPGAFGATAKPPSPLRTCQFAAFVQSAFSAPVQ